MGFIRVAPQVAQHSDGYTIQIGGRYHVEYVHGEEVAKVHADLDGPVVRLHANSIEWLQPQERPATKDERQLILDRVVAGLDALGDACEISDK